MLSREVTSNQQGVHDNLQAVVQKHLSTPWQKPLSDFSVDVFAQVQQWLARDDRPLILDSGCGTGESTARLAELFPQARVLGFDRSAVRLDKLEKKRAVPENCFTIRANAEDLWRQLVQSGVRPLRHYLLYPNPYPKASRLKQRWHASPVFPYLVALGGSIELRSNWQNYVQEFAVALELAIGIRPAVEPYQPDSPLTPFEVKYQGSGHQLWRLRVDLGTQPTNHPVTG